MVKIQNRKLQQLSELIIKSCDEKLQFEVFITSYLQDTIKRNKTYNKISNKIAIEISLKNYNKMYNNALQ